MANLSWESVKEEVTCVVCKDLLTNPKVLPCLHSFCAGCLVERLDRLPSVKAAKYQLECPLCQSKVVLSGVRAVEELPSHFSAARLARIVHLRDHTPNCQNCDENDDAEAYCSQCTVFLCNFCFKSHQRVKSTKQHHILTIKELQDTDLSTEFVLSADKVEMCTVHPTKPLELYCKCSDVLICQDCTVKRHKDHDYDVISDTIESEKALVRETLLDLQAHIGQIDAAIDETKFGRKQLQKAKERNFQSIDHAFQTVQAALNKRRKGLKEKLTQNFDGEDGKLGKQEGELCALLDQLKSCEGFIDCKLKQGSVKDLLVMKRPMLNRKNKLVETKNELKLQSVVCSQEKVQFHGIDQITETLSRLGVSPVLDAEHCAVENLKKYVWFSPGAQIGCVIIAKDFSGERVSNATSHLRVQIKYSNPSKLTESPVVREIGSGLYELTYLLRLGGVHMVSIYIDDKHLPGSPFR